MNNERVYIKGNKGVALYIHVDVAHRRRTVVLF